MRITRLMSPTGDAQACQSPAVQSDPSEHQCVKSVQGDSDTIRVRSAILGLFPTPECHGRYSSSSAAGLEPACGKPSESTVIAAPLKGWASPGRYSVIRFCGMHDWDRIDSEASAPACQTWVDSWDEPSAGALKQGFSPGRIGAWPRNRSLPPRGGYGQKPACFERRADGGTWYARPALLHSATARAVQ